jgi:hypothetical protein|tara:strand:- start:19297 stop:19542 length:246 start_codon:yes stop_codon:yes gene_type:complete
MMDKKKWRATKRKAPKVPDDTCPIIDGVLDRLDAIHKGNKKHTQFQHDQIIKKMEQIRKANEQLRESGHYWYDLAKRFLKP